MSEPEEQRPLIGRNPNWNRHANVNTLPSTSSGYSSSTSTSSGPFINQRTRARRGNGDHEIPNNNGSELSPRPTSNRSDSNFKVACGAILISVILERISFYGITGNLVLFLNKKPFDWESYHAMDALMIFFGITYIVAPLGGWIADAYLGRFWTLLISFVIYLCGVMVLPFLASNSSEFALIDLNDFDWSVSGNKSRRSILPKVCSNLGTYDSDSPFTEHCAWLVYLSLVVIAISSGTIKSNIAPFGSDQVCHL